MSEKAESFRDQAGTSCGDHPRGSGRGVDAVGRKAAARQPVHRAALGSARQGSAAGPGGPVGPAGGANRGAAADGVGDRGPGPLDAGGPEGEQRPGRVRGGGRPRPAGRAGRRGRALGSHHQPDLPTPRGAGRRPPRAPARPAAGLVPGGPRRRPGGAGQLRRGGGPGHRQDRPHAVGGRGGAQRRQPARRLGRLLALCRGDGQNSWPRRRSSIGVPSGCPPTPSSTTGRSSKGRTSGPTRSGG